ncbi:CaiB/BaiF CoA transferase family protein [Bosea sp. RAC05]|jgi:crotonobetainyl-CoA:carnitine CoA-transferase CaiB-like acyl-CoA transferase|uniref:CaiB/BaiF CoA transferase family protein n=1 Tax=Bosea sp. RAC05 TaxID=1842539 RepID=UPI00083CCF89|nr:CoA transferase [Bosea sp. RAC05]AOG05464.1 coA-transferase III family protein [Bosea sp. RAC05]
MTQTTNSAQAPTGALSDLKVLELGSMLAGPFVGSMLGDFGARVIKVEKPGKPDALREWPPHKDDVALWWKTMARNKHAVTLDISRPEARDLALKLIGESDIVIENFRPGTLERWGLSPLELSERFPRIVWVRVSGWGQTGPNKDQGGYATIAEAFSGLASFTGHADKGPTVSAFPMGDYLAGIFGAFGAMAAIHRREQTGKGQIVDVALYEPLLRIIESVVVRFDQTGQKKPLLGNQMEEDVPRNVYATADGGAIAISCGSQRIYEGLVDAMERPELKSDPRFGTMADRVTHRDAIDGAVAAWMVTQTTEQALAKLIARKVVAGKINDIADVLGDAHVAAREAIRTMVDEQLGPIRMPAPVPKLSETPGTIRWTGRDPGAANDEVFGGWLGLSAGELDALRRGNII